MTRALVVASFVAACHGQTPTEIVVAVDTTFGVPCTIDTLHFEATTDAGTTSEDFALTDADLPGSFTLVPKAGATAVTVTVTGMRAGVAFASARHVLDFEDHAELELRFVLDETCIVGSGLSGPCDAVGVGGYVKLPAPVPRSGCGTNGYALNASSLFVMRDACGMPGATALAPDVQEAEVQAPNPPLPFPFTFYGASITDLWIGTGGYLGLGAAQPNVEDLTPNSLGSSPRTFVGAGILPFWELLRTGPTGVCINTTGLFPDRIVWITWEQACFGLEVPCGGPNQGTLTFGVALEETTNNVYVGYLTMQGSTLSIARAHGQQATIGVTSDGAPGCPATQCTNGRCADGTTLCGYTQYSAETTLAWPPLPSLEFDPK